MNTLCTLGVQEIVTNVSLEHFLWHHLDYDINAMFVMTDQKQFSNNLFVR